MKYEFTMFKLESNMMVSGLTPFRFYLLTFGRAPLKPIYTESSQRDQSELPIDYKIFRSFQRLIQPWLVQNLAFIA